MPTGSKILREIPTISRAEKIQRADNTLQQKIRIFKENEQTEANKKRVPSINFFMRIFDARSIQSPET